MNVLIFGATGKVGREIVNQALALGHQVTGFTRNPKAFSLSHENLNLEQGDVLNLPDVERAMKGQEVVLCALGMPLGSKGGERERGTANIIEAMKSRGVERLICLSALGTGESRALLPAHYRYLIIPLFMKALYADHRGQEAVVASSDLQWTIVRPGSFSKGEKKGNYRHGFTEPNGKALTISHGDVADFMLNQIGNDVYLRKRPSLSY